MLLRITKCNGWNSVRHSYYDEKQYLRVFSENSSVRLVYVYEQRQIVTVRLCDCIWRCGQEIEKEQMEEKPNNWMYINGTRLCKKFIKGNRAVMDRIEIKNDTLYINLRNTTVSIQSQ